MYVTLNREQVSILIEALAKAEEGYQEQVNYGGSEEDIDDAHSMLFEISQLEENINSQIQRRLNHAVE